MKEEYLNQNDVLVKYFCYLEDKLYEVGYGEKDDIVKELHNLRDRVYDRFDEIEKDEINELTEKVDKCLVTNEILDRLPFQDVERYVRSQKLRNINAEDTNNS